MLSALQRKIAKAQAEKSELSAVESHLAQIGHAAPPQLTHGRTPDNRVVRMYLWRDSPIGNLCLVTGPSVEGELLELFPHFGGEQGKVYFPSSNGSPALSDRPSLSNPTTFPFLSLGTVQDAVPFMESQGVSEVARSGRGFISAYKKAKGSSASLKQMADAHSGQMWGKRREAFLARHTAQLEDGGWKNGEPTRRHLALVAWGYSPTPRRLRAWLKKSGSNRKNPRKKDRFTAIAAKIKKALKKVPREPGTHPAHGLCYPASEAFYHAVGGKKAGFTPMQLRHEGVSHWWVRGPDGEVYDLTEKQFKSPVPHERSRGKGFLTTKPSERARILMHLAGVKKKNPQARVGKVRTDKKTGRKYVLWRPVLKDGSRPRIYLDADKPKDAELVDVLEAKEQLEASKRAIERKEKEARKKGIRGIWKFGTGRKIMQSAPKRKAMLRASSATPLFDSEGKEYRATYTVLPTDTDGMGPVLASNLPETFLETPEYPSVFQARSLQRLGEKQKIRKIAKDLDPDRLLLPHSDATLGAPVVWEGDGKTHKIGTAKVKTEKGRFYVLGGNGRTIALLMTPKDRYQAYVQRGRSLWPDLWTKGGSPDGKRNILVRVVTKPNGDPLTFAQARTLAGRTQKAASGEESPIGRAISLMRSLGIEDVTQLPMFKWTGIITQDNVKDFAKANPAFTKAVFAAMGSARAESYQQDEALTASLFNDLMVGYLPRKFQLEGFVSEKQERTLLTALPIMLTIHSRVLAGDIQPKWDLFPLLPSALRFSQLIKGKSDKQAIEMVEAAAAQVQLGEGTAFSEKFKSLFDELPLLAVMLGIVLKKGETTRDPALTVEKYLVPYAEKALTFEFSPSEAQMGLLAARGEPDEGSDPVSVLAKELKISLPARSRQAVAPQLDLIANPSRQRGLALDFDSALSSKANAIFEVLIRDGRFVATALPDGGLAPPVLELLQQGLATKETCVPAYQTVYDRETCTLFPTKRGKRFYKDRAIARSRDVERRQRRLFNRRKKKPDSVQLQLVGDIPVMHFASGSNRPGEIQGFVDLRKPVGAAYRGVKKDPLKWVRTCDDECLYELGRAMDSGLPIFLDSGAFSEVELEQSPEYPSGRWVVSMPISDAMWTELFDVYEDLAARGGELANLVAPDRVGSQSQSLDRLRRYAPQVRSLIRKGATVLVPLHRGELSLPEVHREIDSILGTQKWVPSLPFKKAATSPRTLEVYLREIRPKRVHLLGIGPRSKSIDKETGRTVLSEIARAVRRSSPSTKVQMDSVLIKGHVGRHRRKVGDPRGEITAAQDEAREQLQESRWLGRTPEEKLPDWSDIIAFPSEWASPTALRRIAKSAGLSASQRRSLLEDPDEFFQSSSTGNGAPFYIVAEPIIERELAAWFHKIETTERQRRGVREGLRELYSAPSFIRNRTPDYFSRLGALGAPREGEKGFKPAPAVGSAFGGEGPSELANRLLGNAYFLLDSPELFWAWCHEVPEDCDGLQEGEPPEYLADLLGVPYRGGEGESLTEFDRAQIALVVVAAALESDPERWSGLPIPISKLKSRKGPTKIRFARRARKDEETGGDFGEVPRWAVRAMLTDWFGSMVPGFGNLRLVTLDKKTASDFIEEHHSALPYLNARGILFALGVMKGDRLVAVATANTPSARWGKTRKTPRGLIELDPSNVVELTRVASDGTVKGAASKLVSRLIDVLDRAKRGDPDAPSLFVTYQLKEEKGTTYSALRDKGLRPVGKVPGKKPTGARSGGEFAGDPALAGREKIRWECCTEPPALSADWDLVRERQVRLFNPMGSIWRGPKRSRNRPKVGSVPPSEVVVAMFDKASFDSTKAKKWMKDHGMPSRSVRETAKLILVRSFDQGKIDRHTLRMIKADDGVTAVVGFPRT